jgi:tetratricopeptide (TPR) repeat protein
MSARTVTTVVASACLAVFMAASVLLLHRIDQLHPRQVDEDALYISSPKLVRRASLGFDGLMACIYWTRTVQYFGGRHMNGEASYNELAPLLQITTALDPQLLPAYQFGASFLAPPPPDGAGQPERAVQLMKYGIAHNPDDWHLYYELGFVYYLELHDYKDAADAFDRGSKLPNAHPFLKILAGRMAEQAGDFTTARMLWSATFETSGESNVRRNALEHLRAIQVDEDVTNLQTAVTRFGQRTGRLPANMQELAAAEHLPGFPLDPDGQPYYLDAEGRVLVQNPDDFPFITTGTPPGYKPASHKSHENP